MLPFLYPLFNGRNKKAPYLIKGYLRFLSPKLLCRKQLSHILEKGVAEYGEEFLEKRVNYYNKLSSEVRLSPEAPKISEHRLTKKRQVYFFDTEEYLRYFSGDLRWHSLSGDVTHIPEEPTIVKSRPIEGDNANSVLLKLNKVRHFVFVNSDILFSDKLDKAVFRGKIPHKPKRIRFFEQHFYNPLCDLGDTASHGDIPDEWRRPKLTIREQLKYKFILAIEGNDVSSNLKWIMSSNSIAVMPRPEFETWFMEGRLIPGVHYIEINRDYSDLDEKIQYYSKNKDECLRLISAANAYTEQFKDNKLEDLLSLLVLKKYFDLTNF
jgi:hypothetical protein